MKIWLLTLTRESGAEASDVEDKFDEEEEQQQQQQQQASAEDEPQAAISGRGLPTWGLPQERNANIHPFVHPVKGGGKWLRTATKTARHSMC